MIKTHDKITIIEYCRVSTKHQEIALQIESQELWRRRYMEDHPNIEIEVVKFSDEGSSGKNVKRPGFQKMMKAIERRGYKILVVTKLDRLARSLQDLLNTTSSLKKNNTDLVVIGQNIDTTNANGRLLFHILGAFAEFERELIRERLEAGREAAKINGTKSGKPMHRPKVQIDEDGVKFKHKKGWSMHSIARYYKVSITPIRRILNNREMLD